MKTVSKKTSKHIATVSKSTSARAKGNLARAKRYLLATSEEQQAITTPQYLPNDPRTTNGGETRTANGEETKINNVGETRTTDGGKTCIPSNGEETRTTNAGKADSKSFKEFYYGLHGTHEFKASHGETTSTSPRISFAPVGKFLKRFNRYLSRAIANIVLLGILLNVVAHYCPEIAEKFPTIFALYDGMLQGVEFLCKFSLRLLSTLWLDEGKIAAFWSESWTAGKELIEHALSWISTLTY